MKNNITLMFSGSLSELVEFMNANFVNPDTITIHVNGSCQVESNSPLSKLAREIATTFHVSNIESIEANLPEILDSIKSDAKIQAIKLFRNCTGAGLRESKDWVEQFISSQ